MSTARIKDQKDFDLEQMVKIIDTALESGDERIKDALRGLLTITVLCTAENPDQAMIRGPLARIMEDHNDLARRLNRLEDELNNVKMQMPRPRAEPYTPPGTTNPWGPSGYPTGQPWTGTNPNMPKPQWGPTWTSTTFSAGDDVTDKGAWANTPGGSAKMAEDFLRELEQKQ